MKTIQIAAILFLAVLFFNFKSVNDAKPVVYLVGDSTVKNGKGDGASGLWGWGDFISQYFDTTKITFQNHALGGTSSRTFQDKGLWEPVFNSLKKGDYVIIQFGHNDDGPLNDNVRARGTIKGIGNETEEIDNILTKKHEIVHSYGWYIRKLVTNTKSKGAIPIICSPIPRNDWKEGKVPRNDKSYGLWARQIAEEQQVSFIDLNNQMALRMEQFGQAKVTGTYFYERDHTHTSARGAVLSASVIVNELKKKKAANSLQKYILENPAIKLPAKKKIYLIGDSTMANNGNEMACGWGMAFTNYCDTTQVEVLNKARGGRSSRTFTQEGLWSAVKKVLKKGDFVLIQFGHNDAGAIDKEKFRGSIKGIGEETQQVVRDSLSETVHTFGWYMTQFIRETKEKGATPIVLSQTPRNEWPNDKVERRTDTYCLWSKEVAQKENVFYIDLNDIVASKYEQLGKEQVKEFFPKDHTHTNMKGANFNALSVAESLKNLGKNGLEDYIVLPKK